MKLLFVIVGAVSAAFLWLYVSFSDNEASVSQNVLRSTAYPGGIEPKATSASGAGFELEPWDGVTYQWFMYESTDLVVEVQWPIDGRVVTVLRNELDPATGTFVESSINVSTSFDVLECKGGLGADEFVVLGVPPRGGTVVERWSFAPQTGGYTAWRDGVSTPIGTPIMETLPPLAIIAGGGPFVPPGQRGAATDPVREELYRGPSLGDLLVLANDPDERFSLVFSRSDDRIWQIPWNNSGNANLIEDLSTTSPGIFSTMDFVHPVQHLVLGRCYRGVVADPNAHPFLELIMIDGDDDGVFDSFQSMTNQDLTTQFVGDWTDDFVNFTGVGFPD